MKTGKPCDVKDCPHTEHGHVIPGVGVRCALHIPITSTPRVVHIHHENGIEQVTILQQETHASHPSDQ